MNIVVKKTEHLYVLHGKLMCRNRVKTEKGKLVKIIKILISQLGGSRVKKIGGCKGKGVIYFGLSFVD